MKYQVDGWNNFCRVFELPTGYPTGYCFGGGKPVMMLMVDWFNPVQGPPQPAVTKKAWEREFGPIETTEVDGDELTEKLVPWLRQKEYVNADGSYLVLCDFGLAITFKGSDADG